MKRIAPLLVAGALTLATSAHAAIKIGAVLSLTGPAASLGIPESNTLKLLPKKIGNQSVEFIILDSGSNPNGAVRAVHKLIDEDKVDIIFGPSITPNSLAVLDAIGSAKTPMISLAGSSVIAAPVKGNKVWAFKLAPEEPTMAHYIFKSMAQHKQTTVGFIGFNDAFGNSFLGAMGKAAEANHVKVVANERYNRGDTSVAAQALKIMAAAPDAVIIGAAGTPGVTPVLALKKVGYKGQIFINQGMANSDVLRVGGAAMNGVLMPVSPVLVAEQLPDSNPVRAAGLKYIKVYEGKYGAKSRNLFGATAWDAFSLLEKAVKATGDSAKPGTAAFRKALRDNLEKSKDVIGAQGVFNMSPTNHNGTDLRAQVLVRIENGGWHYVPMH